MKYRFCKFMERLLHRTLCNNPDKAIFGSHKLSYGLYNFTGKLSHFWHRQTCERCQERHAERKATP